MIVLNLLLLIGLLLILLLFLVYCCVFTYPKRKRPSAHDIPKGPIYDGHKENMLRVINDMKQHPMRPLSKFPTTDSHFPPGYIITQTAHNRLCYSVTVITDYPNGMATECTKSAKSKDIPSLCRICGDTEKAEVLLPSVSGNIWM